MLSTPSRSRNAAGRFGRAKDSARVLLRFCIEDFVVGAFKGEVPISLTFDWDYPVAILVLAFFQRPWLHLRRDCATRLIRCRDDRWTKNCDFQVIRGVMHDVVVALQETRNDAPEGSGIRSTNHAFRGLRAAVLKLKGGPKRSQNLIETCLPRLNL